MHFNKLPIYNFKYSLKKSPGFTILKGNFSFFNFSFSKKCFLSRVIKKLAPLTIAPNKIGISLSGNNFLNFAISSKVINPINWIFGFISSKF